MKLWMLAVILYAHNIEDEAQLSAFVAQIRALNGAPLLCIDEEGGRADGHGLSAGAEGRRHHGLYQALPRPRRHPGRHALDQSVRRILRLKRQMGR